jgi:hypothetical protein
VAIVPVSRVGLAVLLAVAATLAASCGDPGRPPTVRVSVTAPVDGATVSVPDIVVLGTIEPKDAHVAVSGSRAQVSGGTFQHALSLHTRHTQIEIVGTARGYLRSMTIVSITYDGSNWRSHTRLTARSRGRPADEATTGGFTPEAGDRPSGSGFEADFVGGCANSGGTVAGCLCMWHELTRRGFDSETQWEDLIREWRRSFASSGVIVFPPAFKAAILACAPGFR